MGTKREPGAFDCYSMALPDEPLFILKATDVSAPSIVETWAYSYEQRKRSANEWDRQAQRKHREALQVAEEMRTWFALSRTSALGVTAAGDFVPVSDVGADSSDADASDADSSDAEEETD